VSGVQDLVLCEKTGINLILIQLLGYRSAIAQPLFYDRF